MRTWRNFRIRTLCTANASATSTTYKSNMRTRRDFAIRTMRAANASASSATNAKTGTLLPFRRNTEKWSLHQAIDLHRKHI